MDTPTTPGSIRDGRAWDTAAWFATLAVAIAWLARLVPQALAARLQTDECFHAWVSRWVGQHGALPGSIPGLYGDFPYFYPPLFHVLGGLCGTLGNLRGFLLTNVLVSALLLVVIVLGARRLGAPAAARWAVALCVATQFLSLHTVRLYVEDLSTLLVVAAALRLASLLRAPSTGDAVALGLALGLAIVAKYSALALPPGLVLLAVGALVRGNRPLAAALAGSAVLALAVAAPWLLHVQARMGSPIYPAMSHDVHPLLMQLNVAHFTPPPRTLWTAFVAGCGPAIGAFTLAAVVLGAVRRRGGVELGLAGACAALALAGPLQSMLAPRHLLPLMIAIGVLAAVGLDRSTAGLPRARRAADVAAIAFALWAVVTMPKLRAVADLDEPVEMDAAFAAIRAHVPAGETVLARETYDVLWYADRAATWPVPFGQHDPPVGPFLTTDPDSIAAALTRHRIRWVLLTDDAGPPGFDGGDWPQPTLDGIGALVRRGGATEVWREGDHALVRVGPRPRP